MSSLTSFFQHTLKPLALAPAILFLAGCGDSVTVPKHKFDADRDARTCTRPAVQGVGFKKSFELASVAYKGIQTGGFSYKKNPKFFSAISRLSKDMLMIDYQVCVARLRHGYNNVQAEWLRSKLLFFKASPTATQVDKWQKDHPFPGGGGSAGASRTPKHVKMKTTGDYSPAAVNSQITIKR